MCREKDTISSAMSSPLTSLSSLDDFGDDSQEPSLQDDTAELNAIEVLSLPSQPRKKIPLIFSSVFLYLVAQQSQVGKSPLC
jgi:hypothetical protein